MSDLKMKILHTADWHLGKKLDHFSRLEEQRQVLNEICEIANTQNVDAVIIAGDIYDTPNPPTEAVELFYKTAKRLAKNGERAIIAIAGNHDSPERIEAPEPLAKECGIFLLGFPHSQLSLQKLESGLEISKTDKGFLEFKLPKFNYPLRIIATAYANEYRLKKMLDTNNEAEDLRESLQNHWQQLANKYCNEKGVNILTAHLFVMKKGGEQPEEPDGEKPIVIGGASAIFTESIPHQIQYTALGHLHRYQKISGANCPVVYSSSPLAYSFAEANQKKYVAIIEASPKEKVALEKIELKSGKPLLRKTAHSLEEAILWLNANQHALVELNLFTDTYLKGTEKQQLKKAHSGIVSIIPNLSKNEQAIDNEQHIIDLTKSIDELFVQYFESKFGQKPNQSILDLFKQVKGNAQ